MLLLFSSFCSGAQDNNYVYKDTAMLYADSVEARGMEVAPVENNEKGNKEDYVADTVLRYNQLSVDPDSIMVLKNSKPFGYAKNLDSLLFQYQQSLETDEASSKNNISWLARFFLSPVTKYFFWMMAAIFVFFILYKLFFTEGFFQRSYPKADVTLLPDENENSLKGTDYGKLIGRAVNSGDYRLAVRYHYLLTLQKLSSKGVIQFSVDKTNNQYVGGLSGKTYQSAFASLTLDYEYVWYGEFEIDENAFNTIQNKYKQFNSGV